MNRKSSISGKTLTLISLNIKVREHHLQVSVPRDDRNELLC